MRARVTEVEKIAASATHAAGLIMDRIREGHSKSPDPVNGASSALIALRELTNELIRKYNIHGDLIRRETVAVCDPQNLQSCDDRLSQLRNPRRKT